MTNSYIEDLLSGYPSKSVLMAGFLKANEASNSANVACGSYAACIPFVLMTVAF